MTLQIRSGDSVGNIPILQVRKLLKTLGSDSFFLEYFEDRALTATDTHRLGESLLELGYIAFDHELNGKRLYKVIEKGRELVRGSLAPRIKRKTAEIALTELIERANQLNASPGFFVSVDRTSSIRKLPDRYTNLG